MGEIAIPREAVPGGGGRRRTLSLVLPFPPPGLPEAGPLLALQEPQRVPFKDDRQVVALEGFERVQQRAVAIPADVPVAPTFRDRDLEAGLTSVRLEEGRARHDLADFR